MRTPAFAIAFLLAGGGSQLPAQQRNADPGLPRELAALAETYQSRLPIRLQNGIVVTQIRARGAGVVYSLRVSTDVDAGAEGRFRAALPEMACADSRARAMFARGGIYTYLVTDAAGDSFTVSIDRC